MDDFAKLKGFIAANPNRGKGLDRLPSLRHTVAAVAPVPAFDLPGPVRGWVEYNVSPPGPLSAVLLIQNKMYGAATPAMRQQMLLEYRTTAAELIDRECRAGSTKLARQRKKAHEWLAADPATLTFEQLESLWEVLATVFSFQSVCITEAGPISFAPAQVHCWSAEKGVCFVEKGLSKVWVYEDSEADVVRGLANWLSKKELAGTKIGWPVADGALTKTALIEELETLPSWRAEFTKQRKEELAEMAGRARALKLLDEWQALDVNRSLMDDGPVGRF